MTWAQWQQCGALVGFAWAIWGTVRFSWFAGARYWSRH
jgi:hypothetical protein